MNLKYPSDTIRVTSSLPIVLLYDNSPGAIASAAAAFVTLAYALKLDLVIYMQRAKEVPKWLMQLQHESERIVQDIR